MSASTTSRRRALITALGVLAIVVLCGIAWLASGTTSDDATDTSSGSATTAGNTSASSTIPDHVLTTLALIDAGDWPEAANAPGTRGGTVFRNNERNLAVATASGTRITYREWDVNAKKPGQGRDAERIVTGSDGSAWYTDEHYRSFGQIRGPSR